MKGRVLNAITLHYLLNSYNLYFPLNLIEISQVAIHIQVVADNMNAIEIIGTGSAKNYIPIKRDGSEPSTFFLKIVVLHLHLHWLMHILVFSDLPAITLNSNNAVEVTTYRVPFGLSVCKIDKNKA